MPAFTLEPRLKSRSEISRLFQEGKDITEFPVKLIFTKNPESETIKLIFSVSKRKIKHAVKRNLIKRRMKEAYRKNKVLLIGGLPEGNENKVGLSIGFVYLTSKIEPFPLMEEKIILILQRLSKLLKTTRL
jgi:ribonuclease P protein component